MNKKIKKYIKFLMGVMLISSLMIPSYASLSTSDGSAFVTKAEFDSILSDFDYRLTSFESVMNSKLESDISTYLDSNGLWSAMTQKVNDLTPSKTEDGGRLKNLYYGAIVTRFDELIATIIAGGSTTYKKNILNMTLVDNISKTGLCSLSYNCTNPFNICWEGASTAASSDGVQKQLVYGQIISKFNFSQKDTMGNVADVASIKAYLVQNIEYVYGAATVCRFSVDEQNHMELFFVESGKSLDLDWSLYYTGCKDNTTRGDFNAGSGSAYRYDTNIWKTTSDLGYVDRTFPSSNSNMDNDTTRPVHLHFNVKVY